MIADTGRQLAPLGSLASYSIQPAGHNLPVLAVRCGSSARCVNEEYSMTGILNITSSLKQKKIKKLTQEGLSTPIIAERLGLDYDRVRYVQLKNGLVKRGARTRRGQHPNPLLNVG